MNIFETHAHYDDEAFDADRNTLLERMHMAGVAYIVNVACSMQNSRDILQFVQQYDFLYGTVGVHPEHTETLTMRDMEELKRLAAGEKILAIGEIGLDYHYEEPERRVQQRWFSEQLAVARACGLPVVIHSRDAAQDTFDIMRSEHQGGAGGVIHCFSYGAEMARKYLDLGYYIGVGGVVTFKNGKKLKEVVSYVPIDRIVLETDAPYLAPTPYRGKRNCSLYLQEVAAEIARLKQMDIQAVYDATFRNAKMLYRMMDTKG